MTNKIINKFQFSKLALSQTYHQNTKLTAFKKAVREKDGTWPKEWTQVYYKGYPRFEKIKLPEPKSLKQTLTNSLKKRKSCRDFLPKEILLKDLSTLLYYSFSLKNKKKPELSTRFYPSAGGRYPLETYLIIFNVKGIRKGIYHYHLRTHSLEFLWSYDDLREKVLANFDQLWIREASALLIISAVFWRNEVKYGDRGYRHVLIETGTVTQNIYLLTEALKLGCCVIDEFIDDGLNHLLDIDGVEESVTTVCAIGHKKYSR